MLDRELLFPSVALRSYSVELGESSCSYAGLGPNLIVMLSLDLDAALRSVAPTELKEIGLDEDQAWVVAMENLGNEVAEGRLKLGIGSFEDGGKAAFFDGHWLASAAIFHNGLYPWFAEELGSNDLYALVSERESAVVFAGDCSPLVRERVELFISKAGAHSRKPFGRNLFRLEADGPVHVE
jgi:hypothetical protein